MVPEAHGSIILELSKLALNMPNKLFAEGTLLRDWSAMYLWICH
jgi:hypothetical protein